MTIDWEIINKSLSGELSEGEREILNKWLADSELHRNMYDNIKIKRGKNTSVEISDADLKKYKTQYFAKLDTYGKSSIIIKNRFIYYAASLIIPLMIATFFLLKNYKFESERLADMSSIKPGESKAVLVTANGEKVFLDTISRNILLQSGADIKTVDKSLVYSENAENIETIVENKLIIPRGGEYKLVLADGTKVWLNADSEMRYPVVFKGDKRVVYLKGEAYFDVAKNKEKPFIVKMDNVDIRVYGTEFNINTHIENLVQTTLVEGSVSVKAKGSVEVMIKPSQMAELNIKDGNLNVKNVDVENYVAWKDGEYVFEDQTLDVILQELSLWYDVEVFYMNKDVKNLHFSGYLKKYDSIEKILRLIEKTTHVKFEIKRKAIYVKK